MLSNARSATENGPRAGRLDAVIAVGILAVCAAAVAGFAWTRPVQSTLVVPYTQHGQISYSAPTAASSRYGSGGVHSGQTVYANVVPSLAVDYAYYLSAASPIVVSGNEQLTATVSDGLGATRTIALQPGPVHFDGPGFTVHGTLDMSQLASAAASLAQSAGTSAPPNYVVSVTPSLHASGKFEGQALHMAFDKPVDLSYTPGSGFAPATLASSGPAQAGSVPSAATPAPSTAPLSTSVTQSLSIPDGATAKLFQTIDLRVARIASLVVLAAALVLMWLVGRRLLADANSDDERLRIATRYGSSLVRVDDLPGSSRTAVVDLHSFDGLLRVSRRLECPVLDCPSKGVYAVVDNGTLYRYRCVDERPPVRGSSSNGHAARPLSMAATAGESWS